MNEKERDELLIALKRGQEERDKVLMELKKGQEERDKVLMDLKRGQEELFRKQEELFKKQEEFTEEQRERGKILMDLKEGQEQLFKGQKEIRKDIDSLSLSVARVEVTHGEKLDALFDAFTMHSEKFNSTEKRLDSCEGKIEKHDNQIYILKSKVQGL